MIRVFVPANAVTPTPSSGTTSTSTLSSTTTTPISTSGSSSSSLAGPIAGGVVGGLVVLGVVAGLLFIFLQKPKTKPSNVAPMNAIGVDELWEYQDKDAPADAGVRGSTGLRYIEEIPTETSGRVDGDY